MRLIDADKLIEKLRDFKEYEDDDGRPIHTMSEIQRIDRCINFAQAESTAYDVDKVVEELDEIIYPQRLYFCRVSKGGCNKSDDVNCIDCAIQKAIEIVKRGGKNE